MRTFVGSEATAEADDQCIGVEALKEFYHTLRVALVLQPRLPILLGHILEELLLQCLTCFPYLLIGAVVDAVPYFLIRLVAEMFRIKILGINLTPLGCTPCGEVHAVGDITHMTLLWQVAVPDAIEHLLADLTMQPAHAIDFLTGVAGKGAHAETLAVVVGIRASHADELVPTDA